MPLMSWTSTIWKEPVIKQRLIIALKSQNYETDDMGSLISAKIPKSFSAFLKNGFQLLLVDHIAIELKEQSIQLRVSFSTYMVLFWLVCLFGAIGLSIQNLAPQDYEKMIMSIVLLIPIAAFITVLALISSIKRDVRNAIEATI